MKRGLLLLISTAVILCGCTGRTDGANHVETGKEVSRMEDTNQNETTSQLELTDDEIRILSETYLQEDRIAQGKLYKHQEEQLGRLRFAVAYLEEKYPDKKLVIRSCSEKADSDGSWAFPFYESSDEAGDFCVYVKENTDGSYSAADDYWKAALQESYDTWLSGQLSDLLGQTVETKTMFLGNEDHSAVTSIEEIKALGDKLPRSTDIRVNEVSEAETMAVTLKDFVIQNNLYGSYFLYEGDKAGELASFQTWN